jgi:hypothetical protein
LTPGPSFAHNLGCRCSNYQCEAIFDIYVSRPFQWHQERFNARCFGPCYRALNIRESRRTPSSQLWSVGLHPHTWPKVGLQHAPFINKWSFWGGFWTPSKLLSPWKFSKWIPLIIRISFSYCTRPHSTPNCTCPWNGVPLSHDQAFKWSSSHCNAKNIVSIHQPCFMSSILWSFCNTFFPTLIWRCN